MDQISTLAEMYQHICQKGPNYLQHVDVMRQLGEQCATVVELGVHELISSFGILYGLSKNPASSRSYLGIDVTTSPKHLLEKAKKWSEDAGIDFQFLEANDLDIQLKPIDFLHIDALHTYRHLTYELETFSPIVRAVIAMHDTSPPWGCEDEIQADPSLFDSKYPPHIDRNKRGLWAAVVDFLEKHSEWKLIYRAAESPGVTVIQRI